MTATGDLPAGATVVVVGAGVTGLSSARALVAAGVPDVLVLDRAAIGSGGTGRSSGVVRCHYGVPSLAAMAWRSLPVLAEAVTRLGADAGYRRTGYLVGVGPADEAALAANVAMQRSLGIETDLVDHATASALWPSARLDDMAAFAYEPLGGYGDGHQTAMAFAAAARRGGATLRQHCPVVSVSATGGQVDGVVVAGGRRIAADHVVVAAGAWSPGLVADLGVCLPVRAQRATVMIVDPGTALGEHGVPVLSDLVSLQYVRAEGATRLLVGDSDHQDPEWVEPDPAPEGTDVARFERAVAKFTHRFPGLDGASLHSTYAGCYDVTPDYNPVISATPVDGLWVCAGFSGHGYKISPAVGELVADLLVHGRSRHPDVDDRHFRLERFTTGDLLVSPHPYVTAGQMR